MFGELGIELVRAAILTVLELVFLKNIGEFFTDQVFLLFIKNIDFVLNVIEPRMVKDFLGCEAFRNVFFQHILH